MMKIEMLATGIVAHLEGWEREPSESDYEPIGAILRHPETGERLLIRPMPQGRIRICGLFPTGYTPYNDRHAITVSAGKAPKKIAREIHLRLLERYFPALTKALDQKAAAEERSVGIKATAERLAAIIGRPAHIGSHEATLHRSNPVMEIRVHGPDSVTVIIKSIPEALAREVCRRAIETEGGTNHG